MGEKISALSVAATLDGSELVPVVQSGATKKTTTQDIADLGGGGGGLVSYQNSAMSSPVMAYLWKDVSNNIYRVYEPIRNNDVSRNQFAYADSIDLFPFDSANCFNSKLNDVKLDGVLDLKIQDCSQGLHNMIIKGNGNTGTNIYRSKWIGNYGAGADNSAEIYQTGDNLIVKDSTLEVGTFIDSCGDNFKVEFLNTGSYCFIYGNSKADCRIYSCTFATQVYAYFSEDGGELLDTNINDSGFVIVGSGSHDAINIGCLSGIGDFAAKKSFISVENVSLGTFAVIKPDITETHTLSNCQYGTKATQTVTSNQADKNIERIGATTYELGVTAGAVTAT